jgi:hypothetical protein
VRTGLIRISPPSLTYAFSGTLTQGIMVGKQQIHLPMPTLAEVEGARRTFLGREPRDLFYTVATELIELSMEGKTSISVPEALAVLLQTWNRTYYRFRGAFDEGHLRKLERLCESTQTTTATFRSRSIESFESGDEDLARLLFAKFQEVVSPVGAAKCLHLLAPGFFPLLDRAIAKAYRINLDHCAFDGYVTFMKTVGEQCRLLRSRGAPWPDLVTAITTEASTITPYRNPPPILAFVSALIFSAWPKLGPLRLNRGWHRSTRPDGLAGRVFSHAR